MNAEEFAQQLAASASSDQRFALIASLAADVATYYRQLRKAGLPAGLVNELTLQMAGYLWSGPGCERDDDG